MRFLSLFIWSSVCWLKPTTCDSISGDDYTENLAETAEGGTIEGLEILVTESWLEGEILSKFDF